MYRLESECEWLFVLVQVVTLTLTYSRWERLIPRPASVCRPISEGFVYIAILWCCQRQQHDG